MLSSSLLSFRVVKKRTLAGCKSAAEILTPGDGEEFLLVAPGGGRFLLLRWHRDKVVELGRIKVMTWAGSSGASQATEYVARRRSRVYRSLCFLWRDGRQQRERRGWRLGRAEHRHTH